MSAGSFELEQNSITREVYESTLSLITPDTRVAVSSAGQLAACETNIVVPLPDGVEGRFHTAMIATGVNPLQGVVSTRHQLIRSGKSIASFEPNEENNLAFLGSVVNMVRGAFELKKFGVSTRDALSAVSREVLRAVEMFSPDKEGR